MRKTHALIGPASLAIAAGYIAFSCSSGAGKNGSTSAPDSAEAPAPAPAPAPSTDGGSDQPVWVNSMYLTCDWQSAASNTTAGVACSAQAKPGETAPANLQATAWKVVDSHRANVAATQTASGAGTVFVLPASDIAILSTLVTLSDGTNSGTLTAEFKNLLQGLENDGNLQACFTAQLSVEDCFAAVGIKLPTGDALAASTVKKSDSACAHPEMVAPGSQCQITTDAMTGDLGQAENFFANGNDLMGADGTIKAGDFCDASGIKPRWSKEDINIAKRWYPYWTTAAAKQPCFHPFQPKNAAGTPFYQSNVIYDTAQGVSGEPFCYFVLINESTTLFGGQMVRMHILKNPKIFSDAANPWLTTESIKAMTQNFTCD